MLSKYQLLSYLKGLKKQHPYGQEELMQIIEIVEHQYERELFIREREKMEEEI